jgi:hypothetical protein
MTAVLATRDSRPHVQAQPAGVHRPGTAPRDTCASVDAFVPLCAMFLTFVTPIRHSRLPSAHEADYPISREAIARDM